MVRFAQRAIVSWSLVLAACGDNMSPGSGDPDPGATPDAGSVGTDASVTCVDTAADEFPEGPFGRPDDFDSTGCIEGGLADLDLTGRWIFTGEGLFNYELPFIRDSCEGGIDVTALELPEKLVHLDDTSLFWRTWFEGEDFVVVVARRACAVADSDELAVSAVTCIGSTEKDCTVTEGRLTRFTRPPGEVEADGLELVSEWSGGEEPWAPSTNLNVKVADGLAFLVRFGELRIIDVSDPANPSDLGVVATTDPLSGVDFNDVKLFDAGGLHAVLAGATTPVVDARDPANPVVVSTLNEYAHSVFIRVEDGRPLAYLANYRSDVPIFDLSDPAKPVLVDRVLLPPAVEVHDLYAEADRLYVNGTTEGFLVVDRVDQAWVVRGTMPASYSHAAWAGDLGERSIAIHGDEGQGAHLRVVDVDRASRTFMGEIGAYQTRPEVSIHNIMLIGSRAYVVYYQDGVRILDLADPSDPRLVAYYHTWDLESGLPNPFEGAIGIDVDPDSGLVYVADTLRGLVILRETERIAR